MRSVTIFHYAILNGIQWLEGSSPRSVKLSLYRAVGKVYAELYKLLLYEEGAFFMPHQDSEKAPGMFGTLIICLPSAHQGGELVLEHGRDKITFETSPTSD